MYVNVSFIGVKLNASCLVIFSDEYQYLFCEARAVSRVIFGCLRVMNPHIA